MYDVCARLQERAGFAPLLMQGALDLEILIAVNVDKGPVSVRFEVERNTPDQPPEIAVLFETGRTVPVVPQTSQFSVACHDAMPLRVCTSTEIDWRTPLLTNKQRLCIMLSCCHAVMMYVVLLLHVCTYLHMIYYIIYTMTGGCLLCSRRNRSLQTGSSRWIRTCTCCP